MAVSKNNAKSYMKMNSQMGCQCMCHRGPWMLVVKAVVAIVLPILLIWSLNRLFSFGITYTIGSWFASLVLIVVLSGKAFKRMSCMKCGCMDGKMCGQCNCDMDKK